MLDQVIRGPRVARAQLLAFLEEQLPAQLARARTEWGHTIGTLPDPKQYAPYEPDVVEEANTPCVIAGVGRTRGFARRDVGPGAEQSYQPRHTASVIVWVKRERRWPVQQIRDDYISIVAALLLEQPGIGGGGAFRVDEGTLEMTYSDAAKLAGDRYLAGGSISFELEHDLSVRRVPLGVAEHTEVTATVLSAGHPGLD